METISRSKASQGGREPALWELGSGGRSSDFRWAPTVDMMRKHILQAMEFASAPERDLASSIFCSSAKSVAKTVLGEIPSE